MKIKTTLEYRRITISEPMIDDTYYIEQRDDEKFYVTSENGYFDTKGHVNLEDALRFVVRNIKNYFKVRGEDNPTGF